MSAYKIAQELNEENVPTYTDKPWSSDRILRIISNEKYAGDCLMQKNFVTDDGREVKPKYYVKDDHPAIIKRLDWDKAQTIRENRKAKTYPFTSKLICPYCGASLIRVVHEGRWVSWICATYLQKGKSACLGMRIPDGKLQEITKDNPITEPMIVEEVPNANSTKKRSQKDFRLIPAAQFWGLR